MGGRKNECKEPWIDIVKWTACMLVVLGHFFQSMEKSGIIHAVGIYMWFEHTIYLFHVPLFFLCSGYLYQKNSIVTTKEEWKSNILRKIVNLGVPYVFFSTVSFFMKMIFSNAVNDEVSGSLFRTLLLEPLSPYWYLYILFFLFLFTWTLRDRKQGYILLALSVFIYFFHQNSIIKEVYFLGGMAHREIWFVIGMLLAFYHDKIKFDKRCLGISFLLFPISIIGYNKEMALYVWIPYSLVTGICGCLMILEMAWFYNFRIPEKFILFSRKNTLPVFLMHTIFAAGIRSALCKMGITNFAVHMIGGIMGSILLPVITAEIMRKFRWMYFFISPGFGRKGRTENIKI